MTNASKRLLPALLLLAVGCSKIDLYSNLPEREANEMMAILMRSGVACNKTAGDEELWNVSVPSGDFGRSVELLKKKGYPRDNFDDMGQMFQKSGLVSSESEEKIRFMHALSEELAKTISQIDGVLTARVHIVLPNNNTFGEEVQPSSAAVFIKHHEDAELDLAIAKIKELVVASIEGLDPEKVTVALFVADDQQLFEDPMTEEAPMSNVLSIRMAPESVTRFWVILSGALLLGLVGIVFGAVSFVRTPGKAQPSA